MLKTLKYIWCVECILINQLLFNNETLNSCGYYHSTSLPWKLVFIIHMAYFVWYYNMCVYVLNSLSSNYLHKPITPNFKTKFDGVVSKGLRNQKPCDWYLCQGVDINLVIDIYFKE